MILLEIDPAGLAILEFESDAPRSVDVNRVSPWVEALQGMKVEARNVHFLGTDSYIETV
jgi:hypothetical protein